MKFSLLAQLIKSALSPLFYHFFRFRSLAPPPRMVVPLSLFDEGITVPKNAAVNDVNPPTLTARTTSHNCICAVKSRAPGSGAYAEYAVAKSSQVARQAAGIDHIQAAALPVAALTAWQALFDTAGLQAGQKVLIHAAAGGVGSLAVQFAKRKAARVIGTASAQRADFVWELGADEVIDYRATRFDEILHDLCVRTFSLSERKERRMTKMPVSTRAFSCHIIAFLMAGWS